MIEAIILVGGGLGALYLITRQQKDPLLNLSKVFSNKDKTNKITDIYTKRPINVIDTSPFSNRPSSRRPPHELLVRSPPRRIINDPTNPRRIINDPMSPNTPMSATNPRRIINNPINTSTTNTIGPPLLYPTNRLSLRHGTNISILRPNLANNPTPGGVERMVL